MFVQMNGEAPLRGSVDTVSIKVLELGVCCLKKLFCLLDGNHNGDPILRRGVVDVFDTVRSQPLVDLADTGCFGTDNVSNLSGCEMLAVALVVWVRDLKKVTLNEAFIALLQTNLEVDCLSFVGRTGCLPGARNRVVFLNLVVGR